jgi:hypothetical protein
MKPTMQFRFKQGKLQQAFEKQSEPVAWIDPHYLNYEKKEDLDIENYIHNKPIFYGGIPLYTTSPTRQLSDEEIADMVCSGEYWELSEGMVIIAVHFDKFARAIEAKLKGKQ